MDEQKVTPEKDQLIKKKLREAYLYCIIIIFSIVIITQFVLLLYPNEELSKQFSFASTITSIILSVIAIIMTVVSSDSINSLLHKFRDLHNEIKDTPMRIDSSLESIGKVSENIEKYRILVDDAMQGMKSNVNDISDATTEMRLLLGSIRSSISGVDIKVDALKFAVERSNSPKPGVPVVPPTSLDSSLITNFIKSSSILGIQLLYAVKLSQESSKILNIVNLNKILEGGNNYEYLLGYLIASSSCSLFELTPMPEDGINQYIISNMNTDLYSQVESEMISRKLTETRPKIENMITEAANIPEMKE